MTPEEFLDFFNKSCETNYIVYYAEVHEDNAWCMFIDNDLRQHEGSILCRVYGELPVDLEEQKWKLLSVLLKESWDRAVKSRKEHFV